MGSTTQFPCLVDSGNGKQLTVHGKPFLMLPGELQNSSLSSAEYMDTVWQRLVDSNFNTILGCVTWEDIEPLEGEFHFHQLDKVIAGARAYNLHLVLLWFGSFKNGVSTYVPSWVKTNPSRFPRAEIGHKYGSNRSVADVLSVFNNESRDADARAFAALMTHLREVDARDNTVLMVQVENEVGLLRDSRDRSDIAEKVFSGPVPSDLLSSLASNANTLHADLKTSFPNVDFGSLSNASDQTWEAVFGRGVKTDQLFMAYHYAKYVDSVAATGKTAYPLPMYTNVWLNYGGGDRDESFPVVAGGGDEPGDFPSGGPTSNMLDIWKIFAPSLDIISPDVYLNDYESICKKYRHNGQALFIPEQRRDEYGARRVWIAYGSYAALGASPFGIDTVEAEVNPFRKTFGLLKSVAALVLDAQRRPGSSVGFCFDEVSKAGSPRTDKTLVCRFGEYELTIERCFVFGKPGPGEGMVIHLSDGKFLLIGWGFQVRAQALAPNATFTGILRFEEKAVDDEAAGTLRTVRVLNGDETRGGLFAMMPNEEPDYGGFPISVTIPARTMIAELQVYHLTQ